MIGPNEHGWVHLLSSGEFLLLSEVHVFKCRGEVGGAVGRCMSNWILARAGPIRQHLNGFGGL